MFKIEDILKKPITERSPEEKIFLVENLNKCNDDQKKQIENENKEVIEKKLTKKHLIHKELEEKIGKHFWKNVTASVIKDLGDGEIEAIIASDSLDRHGDILDIAGLDLTKYKANPVVAWAHKYDEPAIAQTVKITKSDGKVVARMKFAIAEYDFARTIYNLYKGGYMRAFSIGFIALEIDDTDFPTFVYTKSEMLEYSAVLIPANADALMLAKQKGIDTGKLLTYTNFNMEELKKILAKAKNDLTIGDINYLKKHIDELTTEQKETYKDLLTVKDIAAEISESVDKKLEKFKKEIDAPSLKKIAGMHDSDGAEFATLKGMDEVTKKAEIFKQWCLGVYNRDFSGYRNIRKQLGVIGKSAMNTTDTSALVPPTEFIAEVERLEEIYGVARKYVTLRRITKGKSVTVILGDDDVDVYDTAEAEAKTSVKLSYNQQELLLRKYAAILPSTDELEEDSAIDVWTDATQRFARAYSRMEDTIVFTRALGAGSLHAGILHATGVNVIDVGDSITDITADHLNQAIYGVPTPSAMNGRFFLHRTLLGLVQRLKDPDTGRYIWNEGINGAAGSTIWGKPYELTEVLPGLQEDADSKPFMVFGDLRYVTLVEKDAWKAEIFNTGTVGDPDEGEDLNLLTQDMKAMRVVKRMNSRVRFPSAFTVIGTTTTVS